MPQRLPMKVDLISIVIFSNTTLLVTLIAIELTFRVTMLLMIPKDRNLKLSWIRF